MAAVPEKSQTNHSCHIAVGGELGRLLATTPSDHWQQSIDYITMPMIVVKNCTNEKQKHWQLMGSSLSQCKLHCNRGGKLHALPELMQTPTRVEAAGLLISPDIAA